MDNKELEKIYNDTYRSVYWTAMSLLKNEDDAQDIVQETFVTLIDSYDTLKDKNKVAAWLKKIAANKCLDILRRTKTVNAEDDFFETVEAFPEDFLPESILESAEKRRIIMDIIDNTLSDDIKRTLILFYFDEMTTKEIASLLGIPQGTVLWRLNFAKKKIKKEVEKYEEENNDKLYTMAVPFLTKLFEKEAGQVPLKPIEPSLLKLTASAQAPAKTADAKVTASSAAEKGVAGIASNKFIIGAVAFILAGAAAVGVFTRVKSDPGEISGETTVKTVDSRMAETEATSEVVEETSLETTDETVDETADETAASGMAETEVVIEETQADEPASDLTGTWMRASSSDNTDEYMVLNEDGTLDIRKIDPDGEEVARASGTYTVEGNEIILSLSDGTVFNTVTFTVDGNTLTFESPDYPEDILIYSRQDGASAANPAEETSADLPAALIGTWTFSENNYDIYLTFSEDGTVEMREVNAVGMDLQRETGVFTVEGNSVSVSGPGGAGLGALVYTLDGDTLTLENPDYPGAAYVLTRVDAFPQAPEYSASDLAGTWMITDGDTWIYMAFDINGTVESWVIEAPGEEIDRMTDTYTIAGNELTLTYPNGRGSETFIISIDGDTMIMVKPDYPDVPFEYTRQGE